MAPPVTPVDYLRTNMHSAPVTTFLAYLDPSMSKNLISSSIGVNQETKDTITKKVAEMRESAEKDPAVAPLIQKFRKATESVRPYMAMGNPWKTQYVIDNLLHEWVKVRVESNQSVPVPLQGLDKTPAAPAHYLISDKVYESVLKELKVPDKLGPGQKMPNKVRFPENVQDTEMMMISMKIIGEQVKAGYKALPDESKKEIDVFLKSLGMAYNPGVDEDKVEWVDGVKRGEAELSFVDKNIRISKEFLADIEDAQSKLKEGEKLDHRYAKVISKLKHRIKVRDGISDDDDSSDGTKKKKSRYDVLIKKAALTASGSKAGYFLQVDPILPVFPKITLKTLPKERSRPATVETPTGDGEAVEDKFAAFVKLSMPVKADVSAGGDRIRQLAYDKASILTFIRDNGLDTSDAQDVKFSAIVCKLVDTGSIIPNEQTRVSDVTEPTDVQGAAVPAGTLLRADVDRVISDGKLEVYAGYARRVLDASFYYASQGAMDGSLPWYDSFQKVFGKVTVERRFINLCELVVASGCLRKYVCDLKVGSVLKANNVLKYRLIRISTPQLIFRALKMVTNDFVFRMIDPLELREYYKFLKGGVLAQISAGPLKEYLEGDVDPTAYEHVPDTYMIGDLMPIREPPYFERIIKQAKIIFDVYGTNVGKWYQGERAIANLDTQDGFFKEVVKAIKVVDSERVKAIAEVIAAEMNIADLGNDDNIGAVKGYLMTVNLSDLQTESDE